MRADNIALHYITFYKITTFLLASEDLVWNFNLISYMTKVKIVDKFYNTQLLNYFNLTIDVLTVILSFTIIMSYIIYFYFL